MRALPRVICSPRLTLWRALSSIRLVTGRFARKRRQRGLRRRWKTKPTRPAVKSTTLRATKVPMRKGTTDLCRSPRGAFQYAPPFNAAACAIRLPTGRLTQYPLRILPFYSPNKNDHAGIWVGFRVPWKCVTSSSTPNSPSLGHTII